MAISQAIHRIQMRRYAPHDQSRTQTPAPQDGLTQALGWFSVALGVAQITMPRQLGRLIGVRDRPVLMRVLGLREITAGVGILSRRQQQAWLWSRVGGDFMDLALLGSALRSDETQRVRVAAATAAVAGVTALDLFCSQRAFRTTTPEENTVHIKKSVAINRPVDELYQFWRNVENLPQVMSHLRSVQAIDDKLSHWTAKAPMGAAVEWESEIVDERANELIAWRSLANADVTHYGSVHFESLPGGRGTLISVDMRYTPPAGKLGALIAKLFQEEPEQQAQEDLRRFKQLMETGEIATTAGQPSGRRTLLGRVMP